IFLFVFILRRSLFSTFFPYTTLFRSVFDFVLTPQMNRLKPFGLEGYPSFGEVLPVLIVIVALTLIAYAASGWLMSLVTVLGLVRSEEHTSELQSRFDLVCRLLLEKKK